MSGRARAWLAQRTGSVPPTLAARMESAVAAVPDGGVCVADTLAEAAQACLRAALEGCDRRDAALHLLAADALITSACEAAAFVAGAVAGGSVPGDGSAPDRHGALDNGVLAGGSALEELALRMTPERLAMLLPATDTEQS